jgi:fumarate reductase flavoprotein subunit
LREKLYDTMWHKVGIIRDAAGLEEARAELDALDAELDVAGLGDGQRAFNLTWHDWLNLKSLVAVSGAIAAAAAARRDSRGAHFRADYPQPGPLEQSAFTSIRLTEGKLALSMKPVSFTRVRPGETLLKDAA